MAYFDIMITDGWAIPLVVATLITLAVSVAALSVGMVVGALITWCKIEGNKTLYLAADFYTTLFRGVPDLLVVYLFYFGGSSVLSSIGEAFGYHGFIGLPAFLTGALAIGIVSAAYQAEVFRSAYLAIPPGQLEAAHALGMGLLLSFRRIIVPQIVRFALPGIGNCWQMVLKESALISVTGLVELLRQSQVAAGSTRQPLYFYLTAATLYLMLTTGSGWFFGHAQRRADRGFARS